MLLLGCFYFVRPFFWPPRVLFFGGTACSCVRSECPALRVGLAALSCSLAGFEAMFWVEWVGADATGRNNSRGGFCLRAPPSNHGHLLCTVEGYRPLYLPVVNLAPRWEGGMVGVRNERKIICQLRQFGPPLYGPPDRRPPADSSHGSYERRNILQDF